MEWELQTIGCKIGYKTKMYCTTWGIQPLYCHNCKQSVTREGNGTPLRYSRLKTPMGGGAQQAEVHGVTKSRIRLNNFTFTFMHWRRKWQPTPVFLPGESQGRGSLVGCRLWSRTELGTTEATQQQQQHENYRKNEKFKIYIYISHQYPI